MLKTFSPQLVEKCIGYFKRVHCTDISVDTANESLHSFAKIYLAVARQNGGELAHGAFSAERHPDGAAHGRNSALLHGPT